MINPTLSEKQATIGRNIRHFRSQFGLTQLQLAKALRLSRQTLSALEMGRGLPNLSTLATLAAYFHQPLERLLVEQDRVYCVFTCDVVNSRSTQDRGRLQKRITAVIRDLNRTFSKQLITRFNITLGDEFQAVFAVLPRLLELYLMLIARMQPYAVNMGIGIAAIHTRMYRASSHKMDGPAFHYSREMVEESKLGQGICHMKTGKACDGLSNLLLEQMHAKMKNLTMTQIEILYLYSLYNNQTKVAEALKVSQGNISRVLQQVDFHLLKAGFEQIEKAIRQTVHMPARQAE
jgi:transcriptional regulator with XRE-family HTH domain